MELGKSIILVTQEKLKPIKKGKMPPQVISRRNPNIFFILKILGHSFFICPSFYTIKTLGFLLDITLESYFPFPFVLA